MRYSIVILILTVHFTCNGYEKTTGETAASQHYPAFLKDYRNKTEKLLNSVTLESTLRIQALELKDLTHRAESLRSAYATEYIKMSETFDNFFNNLDNDYLIGARKLDKEDAPEKTKIQFINRMKQRVEKAITTLMKFYSKKFTVEN
ncbi:hypothetical protein H0X06_06750 [Candidatus Dependentiae bacterium]|nr:hypothetical protein [Candidatus Dependentiae bacterium]